MTLEQIQLPIHDSFQLFQQEYLRRTTSSEPLLKEVEEYLATFPGKQLRPTLLLLAAEACQHLSQQHVMLAVAIELLHNASLMHDDVVDESDMRRGHQSVCNRWGNAVAVICGDYYLSLVITALRQADISEATEIMNNTVTDLCRGELKQLSLINSHQQSVDDYLEVISCKTASMMTSCCELGALPISDDGDSHYRQALHDFGYHYGMVFQMRDDMHDTDINHDVSLPSDTSAQSLIDQHTRLAQEALLQLPDTPARQSLFDLLSPNAPQPTNS